MLVIPISYGQLLFSAIFIIITLLIVILLKLGLTSRIITSSIRCYLQLFLLGYALYFILSNDNPLLTIAVLIIMTIFAVHSIMNLLTNSPKGLFLPIFASQSITGVSITFLITLFIINVEPWYKAQYVIPLAGMVFGNSMSSITLASERFFSDIQRRKDEINTLIALGASSWEASLESARDAVKAGLIPLLNRTATVGVVYIPGMMTGQVLAGAPPIEAAKYQIVVVLMLLAAGSLGALLVILWSYKKAFNKLGNLIL